MKTINKHKNQLKFNFPIANKDTKVIPIDRDYKRNITIQVLNRKRPNL